MQSTKRGLESRKSVSASFIEKRNIAIAILSTCRSEVDHRSEVQAAKRNPRNSQYVID